MSASAAASGSRRLRVGQAPAGRRLDAAHAVGDGVPGHPERGCRLGDATPGKHRAERLDTLAPDIRASIEQWLEHLSSEALPVQQVVDGAEHALDRQPVRTPRGASGEAAPGLPRASLVPRRLGSWSLGGRRERT